MAQNTKAGRLVFFQDVAVVEAAILNQVTEPGTRIWMLLGAIAVDSLKSIAVSLNRQPVQNLDSIIEPKAAGAAAAEIF